MSFSILRLKNLSLVDNQEQLNISNIFISEGIDIKRYQLLQFNTSNDFIPEIEVKL